eukprot:SAG22_NODE_5488_length_1005_cov_1.080574_1_plen_302_part_10
MAFGRNNWGQLGIDVSQLETCSDQPANVDRWGNAWSPTCATSPAEVTALGDDNAQVAAGCGYSLVLKTDGRVMAFGMNNYGQLGDGTTTYRFTPIEVTGLGSDNAQLVGHYHSLVLKKDGRVMAFGRNNQGQLGDGTTTEHHSPIEVVSLGSDNAQVVVGVAGFSLVLKSDGRVWGFGGNSHGELGTGTTTDHPSPVEVAALGDDNALLVAGGSTAFALKTDGRIFAFGENIYYQFGDGPNLDRPQFGKNHNGQAPLELTWLGRENAQIAALNSHALVLKSASWSSPCASVHCGEHGSCAAN